MLYTTEQSLLIVNNSATYAQKIAVIKSIVKDYIKKGIPENLDTANPRYNSYHGAAYFEKDRDTNPFYEKALLLLQKNIMPLNLVCFFYNKVHSAFLMGKCF